METEGRIGKIEKKEGEDEKINLSQKGFLKELRRAVVLAGVAAGLAACRAQPEQGGLIAPFLPPDLVEAGFSPDSLPEEILEKEGITVNQAWFIGQVIDFETGRTLAEEDTVDFNFQAELITNEVIGAKHDGELPEKGNLFWTVGTDSNGKPILTATFRGQKDGEQKKSISALICPSFEKDGSYQTVLSPDLGRSEIEMLCKRGVIYAGDELVREEWGWRGVPREEVIAEAIGRVEADFASELPLYLPTADEPATYVARRFKIRLADLRQANPGLGETVSAMSGIRLPIQPKSVEEIGPITIRDYGIDSYEAPSAKRILKFLNEQGWKSVSLTIDLIPVYGGPRNPVVKGWSFRHDPEKHRAIVYVPSKPNQELHLWHELCHEALDSGDEDTVWECARETTG